MESKLLMGGGNIVDHTNEQQRALEQRRKEIAEQKVNFFISSKNWKRKENLLNIKIIIRYQIVITCSCCSNNFWN